MPRLAEASLSELSLPVRRPRYHRNRLCVAKARIGVAPATLIATVVAAHLRGLLDGDPRAYLTGLLGRG